MAETLFNKMAPKGWRAVSAGTVPAVQVNPAVTQVLKEIGIDISHAKPKAISNEMIREADRIITMGCGAGFCPAAFLPKIEDWNIEDPKGKTLEQLREIRDVIKGKVLMLIEGLDKPTKV